MPDPTLAQLATRLAVVEARLGIGPVPTPAPVPAPTPTPGPAAPTGLRATTLPDRRIQLDWDPATGVTAWDVLDTANLGSPVKETVIAPRSIRAALKPGDRRAYAVRARNAAGASALSEVLFLPVGPAPTPVPTPGAGTPADVLDLSRWYLTLPIADPSGKDTSGPWDVYQPELATFSYPRLFRVGTDLAGGRYVEYVTPAKGITTSGSGACRTELRQMAGPNPSDKASFSLTDGKPHTLTCTLTCDGTSIAGRKEVTVGQIHGPGGTPPLMLVVNHTRDGALEVFQQGHRQGDILTGLKPGEKFSYRIDAVNGVRVYAARGDAAALPAKPGFDWPASVFTEQTGLYMKAGCYLKELASNGADGAGIVRHYRLDLV